MTKKIYKYLKDEGFKKHWLDDKSGFWYDKVFPTFFGNVEVVVEDKGIWIHSMILKSISTTKVDLKTLGQVQGLLKAITLIPTKP